ncbi:ABC transporter ATP-binding protein [Gorillibacterium sp. CAU 1737]|uniref:ABC transporter ATP-binding protein n=1 Tax=Gorillibacterium sp. CAU 1737 TaxID=3140362 RepID=UPI0032606257
METLLSMNAVSKRFRDKAVLDSITFTLRAGECMALKGPNGAGKSTLLRLAVGLNEPSSGKLEFGVSRNEIGYVPDRFPYPRCTLTEYLTSMGRIHGCREAELREQIRSLARFAGLEQDADRQIRYYSKGMLQKTALLQALLGRPRLLVMDEPMSGLDPRSREDMLGLLLKLRSEGMALLFSSHEDRWIERLADRVYRVEKGRLHPLETTRPRQVRIIEIEAEEAVLAQWATPRETEASLLHRLAKEAVPIPNGLRFEVLASQADELLLAVLTNGGSVRSVRSDQPDQEQAPLQEAISS